MSHVIRLVPLDPDLEKAESAAIFFRSLERARKNPTYQRLRRAHLTTARPPPLSTRGKTAHKRR